jgi:hypothetical protein
MVFQLVWNNRGGTPRLAAMCYFLHRASDISAKAVPYCWW